jgi:asparagine synthase (glutamine-hydrolysing)
MRITGLTVRFPFCGRNVDHYVRQLRTEFKHLPGEPKRILRAVLARYVPRTIWDGPKHGFNFPLEDFLRGGDGRLVREHLAAVRWRRHGLLSAAGVEDYARRFLAGDSRLTFRVWALVVLGAWLERHDEPD